MIHEQHVLHPISFKATKEYDEEYAVFLLVEQMFPVRRLVGGSFL